MLMYATLKSLHIIKPQYTLTWVSATSLPVWVHNYGKDSLAQWRETDGEERLSERATILLKFKSRSQRSKKFERSFWKSTIDGLLNILYQKLLWNNIRSHFT